MIDTVTAPTEGLPTVILEAIGCGTSETYDRVVRTTAITRI